MVGGKVVAVGARQGDDRAVAEQNRVQSRTAQQYKEWQGRARTNMSEQGQGIIGQESAQGVRRQGME